MGVTRCIPPPRWTQPALRRLVATRPHTPAGRGHSSRRRRPLAAESGQRDGRGGAVEAEEGDSGGSLGGGRLQWGWPWGSSSPMAGVQLLCAADTREMIWEWRSEWEAEAGLRARGWPGREATGPSRRRRASTRRPRPEAGRPQPAGGGDFRF